MNKCPVCFGEIKVDRSYDDYSLVEFYEDCGNCKYSSEWVHGSGAQYVGESVFYSYYDETQKERNKRLHDIKEAIIRRRRDLEIDTKFSDNSGSST